MLFTQFYADCTKPAILIIASDDAFTARVNKGDIWSSTNWREIKRFTINNLKCGVNVI
jgi:hypothetical protein